jgi:hypothetical protein
LRGSYRTLLAGTVLGLLALPAAAGAAPRSTSFRIVGTETAFTSTEGTFVGTAVGNARDAAAWKVVVDHAPLRSLPATITGGSLTLKSLAEGGTTSSVKGSFTHGTISLVDGGRGCHDQKYDVVGDLGSVFSSTSRAGTGRVDVLLTHHRVSLLGRCVTYGATVTGTVKFDY